MNYLLDTCTVLHLALDRKRLSQAAINAALDPDSIIFVSSISAAELACLQERNRIQLPQHWRQWFRAQVDANGWNLVDLNLEIFEEAYSLPDPIHQDPVDRILIASARVERMTLITTDSLILQYPHVQSLG